jgi:hypothetical protein
MTTFATKAAERFVKSACGEELVSVHVKIENCRNIGLAEPVRVQVPEHDRMQKAASETYFGAPT